MKITERTHNAETNEIVDTEREMSASELALWKSDMAKVEAQIEATKKAEANKAAAQAKLAALGLTAEDLKALGL